MTDIEQKRLEAICKVAGVKDIGELSDGFHTFNGLYEQRMILFAALVKAYKDRAWKSYRNEDGEYCFGGGWFIVGIDTPEGGYTYHYESKYWDMFDCIDLPRGKHWDGHTEADAETRLMSLEPELQWIPCSERLPEKPEPVLVYARSVHHAIAKYKEIRTQEGEYVKTWVAESAYNGPDKIKHDVIAWMPLSEPYKGGEEDV